MISSNEKSTWFDVSVKLQNLTRPTVQVSLTTISDMHKPLFTENMLTPFLFNGSEQHWHLLQN